MIEDSKEESQHHHHCGGAGERRRQGANQPQITGSQPIGDPTAVCLGDGMDNERLNPEDRGT